MTVVWIVFAAVLAAGGYYVECAVWPFGPCQRCKGQGRRVSPAGKHFGFCRRCGGSGKGLRVGRRVWNFVQRRRQAGQ